MQLGVGAAPAGATGSVGSSAGANGGDGGAAPPWQLQVAERRAGAPSSVPAVLALAALPESHLVAVGCAGGTVAVYLLQARCPTAVAAFLVEKPRLHVPNVERIVRKSAVQAHGASACKAAAQPLHG